jgi:hypothetical protein
MSAVISDDYLNYIFDVKSEFTRIPAGYQVPDYYFLHMIVIDKPNKNNYHPFVLLVFGDNYIDDQYLYVPVSPDKKFIKFRGI